MGEFTKHIYNLLKYDNSITAEFFNPQNVIKYMNENNNFKMLPDILKEALIYSGKINANTTTKETRKILQQLLNQQAKECQIRTVTDKTIRNWLPLEKEKEETQKNVSSIGDRDTVISLCFALNLDLDYSNKFLIKCGYSTFNFKNPIDVIYIYCLSNKKALSDALSLITKYINSDSSSIIKESPYQFNETITFINLFENDEFLMGDDEFLEKVLLPNKTFFSSYSRTALNEFLRLRISIYLFSLLIRLKREEVHFKEWLHTEDGYDFCKNFKLKKNPIIQTTINFIHYLKNYDGQENILLNAKDNLNVYSKQTLYQEKICENNSIEILKSINDNIGKYIRHHFDDNVVTQNYNLVDFSDFLYNVIPKEDVLFEWLPAFSAPSDVLHPKNRLRSNKESSLRNTVLRSFFADPQSIFDIYNPFLPTYSSEISEEPFNAKDIKKNTLGRSIRDIMILMYYMYYSLYWVSDTSSSKKFGLEDFIKTLDDLLAKCELGILYPANQFDFLILLAVKNMEATKIDSFLKQNPTFFLDDVLSYSFNIQ